MTRAKSNGPKPCACGCGGITRGGRFLQGHDAKLLHALLERIKEGDKAAEVEIIKQGWSSHLGSKAVAVKAKKRKDAPVVVEGAKVLWRFTPGHERKDDVAVVDGAAMTPDAVTQDMAVPAVVKEVTPPQAVVVEEVKVL